MSVFHLGEIGAQGESSYESSSTLAVLGVFVLASAVTLLAGVVLERSGNELADNLGINGTICGAKIHAADPSPSFIHLHTGATAPRRPRTSPTWRRPIPCRRTARK